MPIVFGFYVPVGRIDEKGNDIFFEGGGTVLKFFSVLFDVFSSYYILCMHNIIAMHCITSSFVYRVRLTSFTRPLPRPLPRSYLLCMHSINLIHCITKVSTMVTNHAFQGNIHALQENTKRKEKDLQICVNPST